MVEHTARRSPGVRRETVILMPPGSPNAPVIWPIDMVALALFRDGRTASEIAEAIGFEVDDTIEAVVRAYRLVLASAR